MDKEYDFDLEVSKFELQSHYNVQFLIDTLEKVMKAPVPTDMD